MIGPSKKVAFAVAANLIGITLVVSAAEFAMRWRVEKGLRGAWRSFSSGAPFSDIGTGNWVVADQDLGYRLNPAQPGINSIGIRNPEISASKRPGVVRVIIL